MKYIKDLVLLSSWHGALLPRRSPASLVRSWATSTLRPPMPRQLPLVRANMAIHPTMRDLYIIPGISFVAFSLVYRTTPAVTAEVALRA